MASISNRNALAKVYNLRGAHFGPIYFAILTPRTRHLWVYALG